MPFDDPFLFVDTLARRTIPIAAGVALDLSARALVSSFFMTIEY